MAIPPRFLNDIRDRLSLSDIIGRRVKLTRAGREYKGCCPFHHEKTPSFTVSDDKQFYHCFGCGAHGDVINFVMNHDNKTFIEAVEELAAEAGLEMPQQTPKDIQKEKEEKSLFHLMQQATEFYYHQLLQPKNQDALDYLIGRGLTFDTINRFRLGFSPPDGQSLRKFLKDQGYSDQNMMDVGVIKSSSKGGDPYDFFRDRIMFPVIDRKGNVLAFGGRILPDYLRPPSSGSFTPPKYINSSETKIFHKGRILYGEPLARQAALKGENVIVTEGYADVIACAQGGFLGAVAPMGTALTEDQIMQLWQMIPGKLDVMKQPILCFDGDNAGRRAASRACENILPLLKPNQSARIAFLPDGEDPDSLIQKQGKGSFQKILDGAMSLADFLWLQQTEGQRLETPESRAGLSARLDDAVSRIQDRTVQHHYKQFFKDKLYKHFRFTKPMGKWHQSNSANKKYSQNRKSLPPVRLKKPSFDKHNQISLMLLTGVLNYPALFEKLEDEISQLTFHNERFEQLRRMMIEALSADHDMGREALLKVLIQKGFNVELGFLCSERIYVHVRQFAPEGDTPVLLEDIESAWMQLYQSLLQDQMIAEKKAFAKHFAQDFSKENEDRLLGFYEGESDQHKI